MQTQYNISGSITNEKGDLLEEAMVHLDGLSNQQVMTDGSGAFAFTADAGENYAIRPVKNDNHNNGVSTLDILLIAKHILSIGPLDSPYKMIAADVNNSGSISAFDMIEIRKLILYINTEFPNNSSWRFVDASYSFQDPPSVFLYIKSLNTFYYPAHEPFNL